MAGRGGRRRCWGLALAAVLAAACATTAAAPTPAPPSETLVVGPGQSATEIALDRVPPGTTIAQFLLALHQLNPQAFAQGDLNRLLAQARLRLPTAEEANRVPPEEARAQLAQLGQGQALPEAPASGAQPAAPAVEPAATLPTPPASSAEAPTATPAAAGPRLPGTAWALVVLAAAGLLWWLRSRTPAAPPQPAAPRAAAADLEDGAQGRFQPVLPKEPQSTAKATASPTSQPPAARPALFDLDLSLDGPAPALDLPASRPRPATGLSPLGALPDLDLGRPAPKAAAPRPLDLSGLSLDLDAPPGPRGKP